MLFLRIEQMSIRVARGLSREKNVAEIGKTRLLYSNTSPQAFIQLLDDSS